MWGRTGSNGGEGVSERAVEGITDGITGGCTVP
jgi:hypothetical protein